MILIPDLKQETLRQKGVTLILGIIHGISILNMKKMNLSQSMAKPIRPHS